VDYIGRVQSGFGSTSPIRLRRGPIFGPRQMVF
jgi:hypothetical protein